MPPLPSSRLTMDLSRFADEPGRNESERGEGKGGAENKWSELGRKRVSIFYSPLPSYSFFPFSPLT